MPLEAQGFELATQSIKRKENKDFQHIQRALTVGKEPAAFWNQENLELEFDHRSMAIFGFLIVLR